MTGTRIRQLSGLLQSHLAGEVIGSASVRKAYARDASPYRRLPALVIRPRDRQDVVALVNLAREHGLPLIARGAGTSLAGQCVPASDAALIVDFGAHFRGIDTLDVERRKIVVQPGVVRDDLNRQLAPHRLQFAPDPSTSSRCQIGGMIGNNAWGLHAVSRGTTREHVVAMEVVLAGGSTAVFDDSTARSAQSAATTVARRVGEIVREYAAAIRDGYPSARAVTSNAGYALDVMLKRSDDTACNLTPLLCGAEGTLAIVTRATLKLVETPRVVRLCCLSFASTVAALQAVAGIKLTNPAALELMDRAILKVAAAHPEHQGVSLWQDEVPAAVLLVEYAGTHAAQVEEEIERLRNAFGQHAHVFERLDAIEAVWALRRAALSLLMQADGGLRAVTGIEDAAVAVADLPEYFSEVAALLQRFGLPFYAYGPVGMGSLHIRPELDLRIAGALARYEQLLDAVAAIVLRFGGSFTCKHGDGRMRGKYLATTLGEQVMRAMREVKQAFDPHGILNPGKILDCPPLTADIVPGSS